MDYRQQLLKPQKRLRDRHWPDTRNVKYATCRALSHATGIIAPMSTPIDDSGKVGLPGCCMLYKYYIMLTGSMKQVDILPRCAHQTDLAFVIQP